MALQRLSNAPPLVKVDGLNLYERSFPILFKQRIDDIRLKRGEDILIATYPRTGEYGQGMD